MSTRAAALKSVVVVCITCLAHDLELWGAEVPSYARCVDGSVATSGDGTSWETAYQTLQEALTEASGVGSEVQEIWVAQGVYRPCLAGAEDRAASFALIPGVQILGGFAGAREPAAGRDPGRFLTVLSGDLAADDDLKCEFDFDCDLEAQTTLCIEGHCRGENSYHVVTAMGVVSEPGQAPATLDGFTIAGGMANGDYREQFGGGAIIWVGNPTFLNCTFEDNYAFHGGGVAIRDSVSFPVFEDCTFANNVALDQEGQAGDGGGVYLVPCLSWRDCLDTTGVCTHMICEEYQCSESDMGRYGDTTRDGVLNLFDIFCILDGIEGNFDTCTFEDNDVEPCEPNGVLNVNDVLAVSDAVGGIDPCCGTNVCCFYNPDSCTTAPKADCEASEGTFLSGERSCDGTPNPCGPAVCCLNGMCDLRTAAACVDAGGEYYSSLDSCDPNPCPQPSPSPAPAATETGATGGSGSATETFEISLSTRSASGPAGARFEVDVFADRVSGLRGYELALALTGGSSGTLEIDDVRVDERRRDYVFAGLKPLTAVDVSAPRIVSLLHEGSVDSATPAYLATFVYQSSRDASGTFQVTVVPGDGTRGTMAGHSNRRPIQPILDNGTTITVTAP